MNFCFFFKYISLDLKTLRRHNHNLHTIILGHSSAITYTIYRSVQLPNHHKICLDLYPVAKCSFYALGYFIQEKNQALNWFWRFNILRYPWFSIKTFKFDSVDSLNQNWLTFV